MPIQYQIWTGWPTKLRSSFRRRVSRYVRNCNSYKIGITNNPENRFSQPDYSDNYNRMIVMYQTSSLDSARDLEWRLIDDYQGYSDNINAGGGGPAGDPPYFLYVVINDE